MKLSAAAMVVSEVGAGVIGIWSTRW